MGAHSQRGLAQGNRVQAFDTIRNLEWYRPDPMIYTYLIALTGKAGEVQLAEELFRAMDLQKCPRTTPVYTAMLDTYGRHGRLWDAMSLFEEMKHSEMYPPDEATYSAVIRALCRSSRMMDAELLLAEMPERGCLANEVTYNIVIDGYGRLGEIEKMQSKFVEMVEAGCVPDTVTYNTLVRSFGKYGLIENMEATFESMQVEGSAPDHFTYNALIDAYGKWGFLDKMKRTLRHMIRSRYRLTAMSFNSAIDAYGKAGMLQDMENCLREMKQLKVKPNQITYCSIIYAYGKQKMSKLVGRTLVQMNEAGVKPDVAVYNAAIDAYGEAQAFGMVESMWKEMNAKGCKPDNITYASLISVYAKGGFLSKMEGLYEEMSHLDIRANAKSLKAMMGAYSKVGLFEKVRRLWSELGRMGEKADTETFNHLILSYCRAGLYEEMAKTYANMLASKCQTDSRTFQILIEGFAVNGEIKQMEKTMKTMRLMKLKPAISILTHAITAYGKAGRPGEAERVFQEIQEDGMLPDPTTYSALLIAQGRSYMVEEVSGQLLEVEGLPDRPPSVKACIALLWVLSESKSWEDARDVLRWMAHIEEGRYSPLCRLFSSEYSARPLRKDSKNGSAQLSFSEQKREIDYMVSSFASSDKVNVEVFGEPDDSRYEFTVPAMLQSPTGRAFREKSSSFSWRSEPLDGYRSRKNVRDHRGAAALKEVNELFDHLGKLNPIARKWGPFYDALIAALWSFGLGEKSKWVFVEGQRRGSVKGGSVFKDSEWSLDVHLLRPAAAAVAILQWLEKCEVAVAEQPSVCPDRVAICMAKNGIAMSWDKAVEDGEVEESLTAYIEGILRSMGAPFSAFDESSGRLECEGRKFLVWLKRRLKEMALGLSDAAEPCPGWAGKR